MTGVKVFFCKPTNMALFYQSWWCEHCKDIVAKEECGKGPSGEFPPIPDSALSPVECPRCHNDTQMASRGQVRIFIRTDTNEEIVYLHKHPGACYEESLPYYDRRTRTKRTGPDGRVLTVICPNGTPWCIDSRCSNCDLPQDTEHRCWIRRGDPSIPGSLHVDKNGISCNAGAGSIVAGGGHWFLHRGEFVNC